MQQETKRSHHSSKVSNACPALPSLGLHEHNTLSHAVLFAGPLLCGQLRAMDSVCRNSASSAVDGPVLTQTFGTSCAMHASVSAAILPLLLQRHRLPLRSPRLPPCSDVRRAASTS
jgi:hypothetical protein